MIFNHNRLSTSTNLIESSYILNCLDAQDFAREIDFDIYFITILCPLIDQSIQTPSCFRCCIHRLSS